MKMTRTKAIAFFAAVGFPKADEWDDAKLIARLAQVTTRIPAEHVPTAVMPVYEELKDDPDVEFLREDGLPAEKPKGRPKQKDETLPEPTRDKDGAPHGTMKASVNAVLSVAWKTDKKIAKEAGIGLQQARRHLRNIMADGKVEKRNQIIYRIKE